MSVLCGVQGVEDGEGIRGGERHIITQDEVRRGGGEGMPLITFFYEGKNCSRWEIHLS